MPAIIALAWPLSDIITPMAWLNCCWLLSPLNMACSEISRLA